MSYAEIYAACMDMFREGYAHVERGRTACKADELRLQETVLSGSMAVYMEVNWQQGREALREQADTYADDAVYRDYGDNEEFLNHYFIADHERIVDDVFDAVYNAVAKKLQRIETEKAEVMQKLLETNLAAILAKSALSYDEIEDIANAFFDESHIDRFRPNDNARYGNGLREPVLYDLIRKQRQGGDISRELVHSLLGDFARFEISPFDDLAAIPTKNGYFFEIGGTMQEVSYEQLYEAYMKMFRADWAETLAARAADEQPETAQNWKYYIISDLSSWSQHGGERAALETYDTPEQAMERFQALRKEPYNSESLYSQDSDTPLARLTLGIQRADNRVVCDLLHVSGGQNYLCTDYLRFDPDGKDRSLQDTVRQITEQTGVDRVLDFSTGTAADMSYAEWQERRKTAEEPAAGISGGEIRMGDLFRWQGAVCKVTDKEALYPDDVVIRREERGYVVEQNVDRFRLAREGEYLGNTGSEPQQQDFSVQEQRLFYRSLTGGLREMLESNWEQSKDTLHSYAADYVDNTVTERFADDEPFLMYYFGAEHDRIADTVFEQAYYDLLTCDPDNTKPLSQQLERAIGNLSAQITVRQRAEAAQARAGMIQPWGRDDSFHLKDGKVYYRQGAQMEEVKGKNGTVLSGQNLARITALIELRTVTRQLLDMQKTNCEDAELEPLRQSLNRKYDAYYAAYKERLSEPAVKRLFGKDADYPILQSLENYNSETDTYEKADIFFRRTVRPVEEITAVDTLEQAYQVSLDQRGKLDIPYMAALLQDKNPDKTFMVLMQQVQGDLLEQGMAFIDPEKEVAGEPFSGIVERAEYLSVNVRRKLAYVMDRAAENPDFQRNAEALRGVIPADIHAEEIAVRMGCPWIDTEDYTKFLRELSGRQLWDTRCEVKYSPVTGEFDILQAGSRKDINLNEGTTYGTDALTMYEIAQKLLNQRRIAVLMSVPSPKDPSKTVSRTDPVETKKAMEKARIIEAKFSEWIFADPARRAKYERRYNDLFNSLVGRRYDGSHLTFAGQSQAFRLRPHQRDCVARAVYGGSTLAAHVVSAGKSAVSQTAVMKKKQLGLINKACVVVPKPLVEQTARKWRKLYPDARLLTMSAADLSSEAKRDLFAARVATGDYDAVIVSVEQFEKMPMSQEFQKAYLQKQLDDLEDMLREQRNANGNRKDATTKQIEAAKKKLAVRLENIMNLKSKQKGKDILLDFEQLGFDYLVVDEAHADKNGFVATKMGDVSGVSVNPSGRAQDMQMKCDFLNETLGQGHILYCTGTPVATLHQL